MTSLTKRLMGEGTRQAMEYEEESMHNVPKAAQNAVIFIAKKVKDNVMHVMTAPVVTPPSTAPKIPEANPLGVLPKAPNALVIK